MASDVIEHFFIPAILVQRPGEQQVEAVWIHSERRGIIGVEIHRFGKGFEEIRGLRERVRSFAEKIQRPIRGTAQSVVGGIGVLHQMIPTRHNQTPEAVHERIEAAAGQMLEQTQIARGRIEAVGAGNGGRAFVFITLWIEKRLVVQRTVAGKNQPASAGVVGADVIVVRRLIWHLDYDRRGI